MFTNKDKVGGLLTSAQINKHTLTPAGLVCGTLSALIREHSDASDPDAAGTPTQAGPETATYRKQNPHPASGARAWSTQLHKTV